MLLKEGGAVFSSRDAERHRCRVIIADSVRAPADIRMMRLQLAAQAAEHGAVKAVAVQEEDGAVLAVGNVADLADEVMVESRALDRAHVSQSAERVFRIDARKRGIAPRHELVMHGAEVDEARALLGEAPAMGEVMLIEGFYPWIVCDHLLHARPVGIRDAKPSSQVRARRALLRGDDHEAQGDMLRVHLRVCACMDAAKAVADDDDAMVWSALDKRVDGLSDIGIGSIWCRILLPREAEEDVWRLLCQVCGLAQEIGSRFAWRREAEEMFEAGSAASQRVIEINNLSCEALWMPRSLY